MTRPVPEHVTAALRRRAEAVLSADALGYQLGTAGPPDEADTDERAWRTVDLVPRVLQGLSSVSTATTIGGQTLGTPLVVAATAAHGLCDPAAETATAAGAHRAGALYCYSSSATVEVSEFGATAAGPWWAQVYVMTDRARTWDYVDRAMAAGADALVLTVDNPGAIGDPTFRRREQSRLTVTPGNYPGWSWATMSASIDPGLTPDVITRLRERSGLPVWVKGLLHPDDVEPVLQAGADGIVVSNHGRRQLRGVVPTASALPAVVRAVDGRVPVHVDGGIRSGTDVLRALTLGASAVGIGRPVLWALAAAGSDGVADLLGQLTDELVRAMAAMGLSRLPGSA